MTFSYKQRSVLLFLCLSATIVFVESIDSKDLDKCLNGCNRSGTCTYKKQETETNSTNGEWTCHCLPLFSGDDCGIKWKDDKEWVKFFGVYIAIALLVQLIIVAYASYQLYITIVHSEKAGWKKWTLISTINALGVVAGLFRIIDYGIDPHSWLNILPDAADEILFNVPIILWLSAGFMLFLYWIELQTLSGVKQLLSLSKMRPYLIGFTILITIVFLPLNFWAAATNSSIASVLLNAFLAIVFLFLIVILTISGIRLSRIMNRIFKKTRVSAFKKFLVKLNRYIFVLDTALLVSIITLVTFQIVGARRMKWVYVIMHLLMRLEEFVIVFVTLLFVSRQKPNTNSSAMDSGSIRSIGMDSGRSGSRQRSYKDSQIREGVDIALSVSSIKSDDDAGSVIDDLADPAINYSVELTEEENK